MLIDWGISEDSAPSTEIGSEDGAESSEIFRLVFQYLLISFKSISAR